MQFFKGGLKEATGCLIGLWTIFKSGRGIQMSHTMPQNSLIHPVFAIWSLPQEHVQKSVPQLYSLGWKVKELQFHTFLCNQTENTFRTPKELHFHNIFMKHLHSYPRIMWILKKYQVKSLVHKSNNWSMSGTFKQQKPAIKLRIMEKRIGHTT